MGRRCCSFFLRPAPCRGPDHYPLNRCTKGKDERQGGIAYSSGFTIDTIDMKGPMAWGYKGRMHGTLRRAHGSLDESWDKEEYARGHDRDETRCPLDARERAPIQLSISYICCPALCRLDSGYLKAYYRRGSAHMALGKYKLAVKDFRKVSPLPLSSKASVDG